MNLITFLLNSCGKSYSCQITSSKQAIFFYQINFFINDRITDNIQRMELMEQKAITKDYRFKFFSICERFY
jgi:hypothetical protein